MKKLLVLFVASMASSLFLYALVSQDQPATHPGLKAADLPPLIAVHELYAGSDTAPDKVAFNTGTKIAWQQAVRNSGEVRGQLTFPLTDPASTPLPTVVLINSEPAGGTGPDSDMTVRFLVNRGYLVLSIDCGNLAGSRADQGGPQLVSGRCTETIIAEEAKRLVDEGLADPAALAILGSGNGGHLALMTMSLEPELFKAAIVHAAVTDQVDLSSDDNVTWKPQQAVVKSDFPAVGAEQESMYLAGRSPIDLVSNIQGAILITHGKADTVVPVEQAQAYAAELRASGKDAEAVYFNHEEHRYSRWQTRVQVARLTEEFLAHHLRGRNGGYDYIELLAKWF